VRIPYFVEQNGYGHLGLNMWKHNVKGENEVKIMVDEEFIRHVKYVFIERWSSFNAPLNIFVYALNLKY
jgi:hypothetical protein